MAIASIQNMEQEADMCINIHGIDYYFGFEFAIEINSIPKHFSILITNHRSDRPYVYGGLCLDNGQIVNSNEHERYAALYDIVNKIVDGAICAEQETAEHYPYDKFEPLINILREDAKTSRKFTKRMSGAKTLAQYKKIREKISPLLENQAYYFEEYNIRVLILYLSLQLKKIFALKTFLGILMHCVPIIYDCKDMALASNEFKKDSRFDINKFKYRRV